MSPHHSDSYYQQHGLDEDRIALWYYARLIRRLRPKGGRLLDFGCGTGHLLRRLSKWYEAYGYDASPYARNRARMAAPDAVVLEDWESITPASLDVIVSLHTLEHIERPITAFQKLAPLLVSGGLLLFVVPNTGGIGHRLKRRSWFAYRDATHRSLLTQGEWLTLVRRAGLKVDWVHGDGMWDAPYVGFVPRALQRAIFGAPAALQIILPSRRPILPPVLGECLIVASRRP
jgi:SAM-dependent methyltransferase